MLACCYGGLQDGQQGPRHREEPFLSHSFFPCGMFPKEYSLQVGSFNIEIKIEQWLTSILMETDQVWTVSFDTADMIQ